MADKIEADWRWREWVMATAEKQVAKWRMILKCGLMLSLQSQ